MSIEELYTKEARVWIPDDEFVWRGAKLLEDYASDKKELSAQYDDEEETVIKVKSKTDLPPLRNPEILIGENDLTSLSYLHEPAVLYNLQVRFCDRNDIYTYCGIVLVAINPYDTLHIYDADTIQAYSGQDMATMDPHIFAVAEESYKRMSSFDENQSIIVSGESGAGKTVSAKYAMRYFATVGGAQGETRVEQRVLASNPIMEAFGNAKTIRNDNSSRFGKYLEIGFNKSNTIVKANMRTYLLEKSRVTFQAIEERNYHIFYQLCAMENESEFEKLQLAHPDIFYFTNQGENAYINDVDDAEDFGSTRDAMTTLGINNVRQFEIFRILSGILHMGNILFDVRESEDSFIPDDDKHLPIMANLLGIDFIQIKQWLCNRKITTAQEVLVKPLTVTQAFLARDALAKFIYSQIFNLIVAEVNKSLQTKDKQTKFIGVLDIYGFETFEHNSFEQFCINYANEKLQQQFCLHVFKLEQEEYVREAIAWSFIDFYDNQPCIDLIEAKLGILDLLDEECKMPNGKDESWCQKLYNKHGKTKHFSKPRMSNRAFIVHHFADNVEYQDDGFLEKNRDTVLEEHINILKASKYELVAELCADKATGNNSEPAQRRTASGVLVRAAKNPVRGSKSNKQTVGSQFRESLNKLMETLFSTTPHYIRCIKPNDLKLAFTFDPKRAVQQLRACGVLETVRISAAGYPSRWTYSEFFHRYRVLAKTKEINRKNMKTTCEKVLINLIEDRDKYQFGKTKIFFRAGQVAYLEKIRSDKLRACGVMIQKHIRGWLAKRQYQKIRKMVLLVQTFGRGYLARRHAKKLRCIHAATVLQAAWRSYIAHKEYRTQVEAVIRIQACTRGIIARRQYVALRVESSALVIQKYIRGWMARRTYNKFIRGLILLQAHVRRRAAKKQLKQLKIEARSVEHVKKQAKGLENKIIELQQKLDEKVKENNLLREEKLQINDLRNQLEKLKLQEAENKATITQYKDLEALVAALKKELSKEKEKVESLSTDREELKKEKDLIISCLSKKEISLKEQLDKANEKIKNQQVEFEGKKNDNFEEVVTKQLEEIESERAHHQRIIKENARLQQRIENFKSELEVFNQTNSNELTAPPSHHTRSPSSISNISMESDISISTTVTQDSKATEDDENDQGYGSARKKKDSPITTAIGEDKKKVSEESVDIGLVTRLQNKVKELEREKQHLQREIDNREEVHDKVYSGTERDAEKEIYDTIKLQELEMENSKLKKDMNKLRDVVVEKAEFEGKGKSSPAAREFMAQFEAMADELERRREECIQLRTLLSTRAQGLLSPLADDSYGGHDDIINEDGELEQAYKTQKDLNKLLERELQKVSKTSDLKERDYKDQLNELRIENERQQKIITQNLNMTPEAKIEATMQHEITRLTSENLDIRETVDKQQEQIKKLKKALKIYIKRVKNTDGM